MGYSPWGCKELGMTEVININTLISEGIESPGPWSGPHSFFIYLFIYIFFIQLDFRYTQQ